MTETPTPSTVRRQMDHQARINYEVEVENARSLRLKTIAEASQARNETLRLSEVELIKAKNRLDEARDKIEKRFRLKELNELRQKHKKLISETNLEVKKAPLRAFETEKRNISDARQAFLKARQEAADFENTAVKEARDNKKRQIYLSKLAKKQQSQNRKNIDNNDQKAEKKARQQPDARPPTPRADEIERREKSNLQQQQAREALLKQRDAAKARANEERQAREAAHQKRLETERLAKLAAQETLIKQKEEEKAKIVAERLTRQRAHDEQIRLKTLARVPDKNKNDLEEPKKPVRPDKTGQPEARPEHTPEQPRKGRLQAGSELFRGMVRVCVDNMAELAPLNELEKTLRDWPDIRVVIIGNDGAGTKITISLPEALPLVERLTLVPVVKKVTAKGNEIQISLKTSL